MDLSERNTELSYRIEGKLEQRFGMLGNQYLKECKHKHNNNLVLRQIQPSIQWVQGTLSLG